MAGLKVKKVYSTYSAYQRVATDNGDIPGRRAKEYRVSFYEFNETPHTVTGTNNGDPILSSVSRRGLDAGRLSEDQNVSWGPDSDLIAEAKYQALSAVFKRVAKARDDGFNGAVFLAEMPQTWDMLIGTAGKLVRASRHAKRGNWAAAADVLTGGKKLGKSKRVANNWLELKYGWLPLLSDVYAAAHKLATSLHSPKGTVFRVSGSGEVNRRRYFRLNSTISALTPQPGHHVIEEKVGVKVGLSFRVSNEMLAQAASMGFTNPALLAWEILPGSFVFDWLISVGGWLESLSAFHGLAFDDGYVTVKGYTSDAYYYPGWTQTFWRYDWGYLSDGTETTVPFLTGYASATPSIIKARTSGFRRDPMSSFPDLPLPKFDPMVGLSKYFTSWALLRQRMK